MMEWFDVGLPESELRPQHFLTAGQSFSWKECGDNEWLGVIGRNLIHIKQTTTTTLCRWTTRDSSMESAAQQLKGFRIMKIEPIECVFSFICSANNNIPRITLLVDRLRRECGDLICDCSHPLPLITHQATYQDWLSCGGVKSYRWYKFPTLEQINEKLTVKRLTELGFGYRAQSVVSAAQQIINLGGVSWLESLAVADRSNCELQLTKLRGVGRKVSHCIGLFSLDQTETIPVDTHVWRIAQRDMDPSLRCIKSLTPAVCDSVGNMFRQKFGDFAGWAHSFLFTAELIRSKQQNKQHNNNINNNKFSRNNKSNRKHSE
eukprot:GHVS01010014.1.p1 GENE.GHVS01010014.1~~GHVS01010014.1.p1  ORF type:complete len:319 (+),score=35.49 GHVS01010014.1:272-1228(+)